MAYLNQTSRLPRGPILVAIAALHVGAIYALVHGLSGIIPPLVKNDRLAGYQIALPKPKDHTRVESARDTDVIERRSVSAERTVVTTSPAPELGVELGDFPTTVEIGPMTEFTLTPERPVEPAFTPKTARPVGTPGLWVTTDDYPTRALRERHEGLTRFRLTVDADGSIGGCAIVESSGHAELDQASCANLTRRGKFKPATDSSGKPVAGSYTGSVRWKLPRGY
jgi:protein TonB